jgi:5-methylcytosine-specific restriction endonuclease McrA
MTKDQPQNESRERVIEAIRRFAAVLVASEFQTQTGLGAARGVQIHTAVRAALIERDKGVCAYCGLDCAALDEAIWWMVHVQFADHKWHETLGRVWLVEVGLGRFTKNWGGLTSTWAGHHIIPVHQGGGKCDLDNYVTLCWRCHAEAHRRKASRA